MIELDENAQRLVRECRSVIENSLPKLSQGMFEKLDDALFQMAEKSENNSKQTEYLGSMREVRKSRQDVQKRFEHGVFNEFDKFVFHSLYVLEFTSFLILFFVVLVQHIFPLLDVFGLFFFKVHDEF